MAWTTNDGREDGAWGVVTGKTGLAHAGAIVYYQSGNLFFAHDDKDSNVFDRSEIERLDNEKSVVWVGGWLDGWMDEGRKGNSLRITKDWIKERGTKKKHRLDLDEVIH